MKWFSDLWNFYRLFQDSTPEKGLNFDDERFSFEVHRVNNSSFLNRNVANINRDYAANLYSTLVACYRDSESIKSCVVSVLDRNMTILIEVGSNQKVEWSFTAGAFISARVFSPCCGVWLEPDFHDGNRNFCYRCETILDSTGALSDYVPERTSADSQADFVAYLEKCLTIFNWDPLDAVIQAQELGYVMELAASVAIESSLVDRLTQLAMES